MVIRLARFNSYLLLLAAAALFCSCQTTSEDKEHATIRLHLEVSPRDAPLNLSGFVPVYRAKPVYVNVERQPFLTEAYLEKATVVETLGGFAIEVQFDHTGSGLLELYSSANPGRRFAVYCEFGPESPQIRWLAAPVIAARISNGTLQFTPDCSRQEADSIVQGLNNVVADRKKKTLYD